MKPLAAGRRTELSLAGSLPSTVPPEAMRELIAALAAWSSAPVSIVLVVDEGSSDWCERWSQT
jgi:fructose-1-phosphate kinase PfkB-like protein